MNGGKASVSYGIINKLNGFNIKHTCFINSGSIGAPILDINSNKVIGITLEPNNNLNYNEGVIMKFPIEDFINKYQIKNNQIFGMIYPHYFSFFYYSYIYNSYNRYHYQMKTFLIR